MKKTLLAVLIGVLFNSSVHAELSLIRQVSTPTISPIKRLYASNSGNLSLMNFNIKGISSVAESEVSTALVLNPQTVDEQDQAVAQITKKPLNYPNPFRKSEGTTLYYSLSKTMDIEIAVYDMMAHQIVKTTRPAGLAGSTFGTNKISLADIGVDTTELSAGAYFFVIMNNGKVLAKGKMAVI
jgi:hypothetical protein